MTAAEVARTKWEWLEHIAADSNMRGVPASIAVFIASRYLNAKDRAAWPAIETLARDTGSDRSSIQRGINKLVEAGYIVRLVRGGRAKTNVYKLGTPLKGRVHAAVCSGDVTVHAQKGRAHASKVY
jgi:hypothetical protein